MVLDLWFQFFRVFLLLITWVDGNVGSNVSISSVRNVRNVGNLSIQSFLSIRFFLRVLWAAFQPAWKCDSVWLIARRYLVSKERRFWF